MTRPLADVIARHAMASRRAHDVVGPPVGAIARMDQERSEVARRLLEEHGIDVADPAVCEQVVRLIGFIVDETARQTFGMDDDARAWAMQQAAHPDTATTLVGLTLTLNMLAETSARRLDTGGTPA